MDSEAKAKLLARLGPAGASEPDSEAPPNEPSEDETRRPSAKPGTRTNMVAREVLVSATGAHPGKTAGERELFTEEATSMLVHENGGVIPLSASVARGQLLLLANVESRREVVAQVKRTYQPMNRCVELEFAEPAPRFWGMEFSAATALLPKDTKYAEAAALISATASPDDPAEPLPAPTTEEVEALKREVKALRGEADAPGKSLPAADDSVPIDLRIAAQVPLPKPSVDFSMPLPKAQGLFRARGKFTPGAKLRLAALTAALVVTVGVTGWYRHRIALKSAINASGNAPAVGASVTTSPSLATPGAPKDQSQFSNPNVVGDERAISPSVPTKIHGSPGQPSGSSDSTALAGRKTSPSATLAAKAPVRPRTQTPTPTDAASNETSHPVVVSSAEGGVVPPKLIKSVKAVASLENVRDFETGNVVIDAVVGTEGEVHYITVVSGPPSLRGPAVEAVKQYRYEPATRNGQPVPEHVHITVRFRFES